MIDSPPGRPYRGLQDNALGASGSSARLGDWAELPRARGRHPVPGPRWRWFAFPLAVFITAVAGNEIPASPGAHALRKECY
jgi:hypothetical protein